MDKIQLTDKITTIIIITALIIGSSAFVLVGTNAFFSDTETVSSSFTASNDPAHYSPPYKPTNIQPLDQKTKLPTTVTLKIYVKDPNDDPMNVFFYNAKNNQLIKTHRNITSNTTVSTTWQNLQPGTTYKWYTTAQDWEGTTQSKTWTFTTNHKPQIQLLQPKNNTKNTNLSTTLKIKTTDIDDQRLKVTFYDASNNQTIKTLKNITKNASITWNNLQHDIQYQWYAIAEDNITQTQSKTYTFTTKTPPSSGGNNENNENNQNEEDTTPENQPPTPVLKHNPTATINENITIYANNSHDPDGNITQYTYNFGDNTTITTSQSIVQHSYSQTGKYNITLTITDNHNNTNTTNSTIKILSKLKITNINTIPKTQLINQNVNITCTIQNSHPITNITINTTNPNNNTTKKTSMQNNNHTFYHNQTYNQTGLYQFQITITDNTNHTITSQKQNLSIQKIIIKNTTITPQVQKINHTVNITTKILSQNNLTQTTLNITLPDNTTTQQNMTQNTNQTNYFYNFNNTNQTGNYTMYIQTRDIDNFTQKTILYQFTITDLAPPKIKNTSIQQKNSTVNITTNITDNTKIKNATLNLTNPNNKTQKITMKTITNTTTYFYNSTYNVSGNYTFYIQTKDIYDNTQKTSLYNFTINDSTKPQINNVTIKQNNHTVNITTNITDNIQIKNVTLNLSFDNQTQKPVMKHINNTTTYYHNSTYNTGLYNFTINATDIYNNFNISKTYNFTIN